MEKPRTPPQPMLPLIGSSPNCFLDRLEADPCTPPLSRAVTEPPKMLPVAEPAYTPSPMPDPETVSQKASPRTCVKPSFELQLPQRSVDMLQADALPKMPPASPITEPASPTSLPSPAPKVATMSQKDSRPPRGGGFLHRWVLRRHYQRGGGRYFYYERQA